MKLILSSLLLWVAGVGVADPLWLPRTPEQAPPLHWVDATGQTELVQTYFGQYLVLNFWATWCAPCLHEMPTLDALARKYQHAGLTVVPVALPNDTFPKMQEMYRKLRIRALPLRQLTSLQTLLNVIDETRLPVTLILNPQGEIIGELSGAADWFSPAVQNRIEHLLRTRAAQLPAPSYERQLILDVLP